MNKNMYQTIRIIVVIIVAAVVSGSVVAEANVLIPLATIFGGMILIDLLRRLGQEIMEDV